MPKFTHLLVLLLLLAAKTGTTQPSADTRPPITNQLIAQNISTAYGAPVDTVERFIREALALEKRYGVPATAVVGIAILESSGFTSYLYLHSNNPFGLKANKTWHGSTFEMWHEEAMTPFRKYNDIEAALNDFVAKLRSRRWFQDALKCPKGDYKCFIKAMMPTASHPGWAADPEWGPKVLGLIERYELENLK